MPQVYIVILNYKRWQDVIECLESIFNSRYDNYTVIVIDNDSQNNSLDHLKSWANGNVVHGRKLKNAKPYAHIYSNEINNAAQINSLGQLIFVQNQKNVGFAAGNNVILRFLLDVDSYIWLLNPDIVVEEDTLSELIEFAGHQPFTSITGSVIRSYSNRDKVLLYGGARINFNSATVSLIRNENKVSEIDFICGGSLFTHTKHFKDIGLLPEEYFLIWEEADWCYKARQKGYKMLVCKKAVCYDKISTSIGKGFLANYYYTLNGLLFLKKYRNNKIGSAFVFAMLRFLKRVFTGKWESAKGVFQGVMTFTKKPNYESE